MDLTSARGGTPPPLTFYTWTYVPVGASFLCYEQILADMYSVTL